MEEVGRASEAKEEDGSGGADENNGCITSKAADTKPKTQPLMDRGPAKMLTAVPLDGGGRQSLRGQGGGRQRRSG
jgi:hypothetical protein